VDSVVPLFEVRSVSKQFGSVTALDGVSLSVEPGEWLAISGSSGSGKTTLLQLFAALEVPSQGDILYKGRDLANLHDLNGYRRTSIGIVFQLHNLLPHLDVRGNIEIVMYGTHRDGHKRVDHVTELLDAVGLIDQQDRKPPELSGGERQRAAIARALANDPEVLLADEPTGSLDPHHVDQLLQLIQSLNRDRQMAIVMVTHDREVARRADRIIQLEAGKVARDERRGVASSPEPLIEST